MVLNRGSLLFSDKLAASSTSPQGIKRVIFQNKFILLFMHLTQIADNWGSLFSSMGHRPLSLTL